MNLVDGVVAQVAESLSTPDHPRVRQPVRVECDAFHGDSHFLLIDPSCLTLDSAPINRLVALRKWKPRLSSHLKR